MLFSDEQILLFNIAMLVKQGWRLMNNDNPLVTACMKAKYFSDGNFLTATLGANSSYVWRSILSTQDIVRKGCRPSIGYGSRQIYEKYRGSRVQTMDV